MQSVPITTDVVGFEPRRGVQRYVIKFVDDLRQISGFLKSHPASSTNQTDHHDITETLLYFSYIAAISFIGGGN